MNFQSSVLAGQLTALHARSLSLPLLPSFPPSLSLPPLSPLSLLSPPLSIPPLSHPSLHGTVPFLIINNYLANWEILFKEPTHHSCLFLFWARWIHSTVSHSVSLRFVWVVPPHLCLGLPSVPILHIFRTKFIRISVICVCCITYPFHSAWF